MNVVICSQEISDLRWKILRLIFRVKKRFTSEAEDVAAVEHSGTSLVQLLACRQNSHIHDLIASILGGMMDFPESYMARFAHISAKVRRWICDGVFRDGEDSKNAILCVFVEIKEAEFEF